MFYFLTSYNCHKFYFIFQNLNLSHLSFTLHKHLYLWSDYRVNDTWWYDSSFLILFLLSYSLEGFLVSHVTTNTVSYSWYFQRTLWLNTTSPPKPLMVIGSYIMQLLLNYIPFITFIYKKGSNVPATHLYEETLLIIEIQLIKMPRYICFLIDNSMFGNEGYES